MRKLICLVRVFYQKWPPFSPAQHEHTSITTNTEKVYLHLLTSPASQRYVNCIYLMILCIPSRHPHFKRSFYGIRKHRRTFPITTKPCRLNIESLNPLLNTFPSAEIENPTLHNILYENNLKSVKTIKNNLIT